MGQSQFGQRAVPLNEEAAASATKKPRIGGRCGVLRAFRFRK
jgi:hypothetical protein